MKADLHTHTRISDGALEPAEVVRRAEQAGLEALAITDHDTFLAWTAGLASRVLRLLIGFEFSSAFQGRELHILGYFKKVPEGPFLAYVEGIEIERRERMREAFLKLRALGVDLDFDNFLSHQTSRLLTSAHVATYLVERGIATTEDDAYERFLKGGTAVVPLPYTQMYRAIEMINEAGGISVWAHPPVGDFEDIIEGAVESGLQGIEVKNFWRPEVGPEIFLRAARKYALVTTGGSDYHSDSHPCPLGSHYVDESIVESFFKRLL